jgi:CBS domain
MNGGQPGGGGTDKTREWLAITMVVLSVGGVVVIAGLAIGFAKDRGGESSTVFNSLLPLFGTWVGTILAFYFARENLQAATDSTVRLSGLNAPQTPVQQVMLPKARITSQDVAAGVSPDTVLLSDLLTKMKNANVHRIPILNSGGGVEYVVHDSTITAYADQVGKNPNDATTFTDTMGQLVAQDPFGKAVKAIAVVGPNASLNDARAAMTAVDGCNDVFVTSNGQRTDPILGWLTNTDLAGLS